MAASSTPPAAPEDKAPAAAPEVAAAPVAAPAPERRFRVVHGAVGGVGTNRKGEPVELDYYAGSIATEKQLGGPASVAHYFQMAAIEEVEG